MKLTHAAVLSSMFAFTACTTGPAHQATTTSGQWLGKEQALAKDRAMEARGMMPTSIDCMMDATVKGPRPRYFVKIEYKPRQGKRNWTWGVGEADEMQVYANTANRRGLKRVQSRQLLDPNSGKRASCALWRD